MLLTPTPFMKTVEPIILTFVDYEMDSSDNNTTWTNQNLGTADPGRIMVILAATGDETLTSATVAGVTLTQRYVGPLSGYYVLTAPVPTGTTGSVNLVLSGTTWMCWSMWAMYNGNPIPYDTGEDDSLTSNHFDITLDIPAGGAAIAASNNFDSSNPANYTWTGLTEKYEQTIATSWSGIHSAASDVFATSQTDLAIRGQLDANPNVWWAFLGCSFAPL